MLMVLMIRMTVKCEFIAMKVVYAIMIKNKNKLAQAAFQFFIQINFF